MDAAKVRDVSGPQNLRAAATLLPNSTMGPTAGGQCSKWEGTSRPGKTAWKLHGRHPMPRHPQMSLHRGCLVGGPSNGEEAASWICLALLPLAANCDQVPRPQLSARCSALQLCLRFGFHRSCSFPLSTVQHTSLPTFLRPRLKPMKLQVLVAHPSGLLIHSPNSLASWAVHSIGLAMRLSLPKVASLACTHRGHLLSSPLP